MSTIARRTARGVATLLFLFVAAAAHAAVPGPLTEAAYRLETEQAEVHIVRDLLLEVTFTSPESDEVVNYISFGDSPIWTGHYLAAQAYRYSVTGDPQAVENARRVVGGITRLLHVTGEPGRLVRFAVPQGDPLADQWVGGERFEGSYEGVPHYWTGAFISRDQYSGVMFGMALAYDLIDDDALRRQIRSNVRVILDYLMANGWTAKRPDGSIATAWWGSFDQILNYLQIGKRVDPWRYTWTYWGYSRSLSRLVPVPYLIESVDVHGSYFKWNLDHINAFNLIRLERNRRLRGRYVEALNVLRRATGSHQNAHFNRLVMGVVPGSRPALGPATVGYLHDWLERPRRYWPVVNSTDPSIAKRTYRPPTSQTTVTIARDPLPIARRPSTDFLWQRSAFQLDGFGDGRNVTTGSQAPGVDFTLPYWMGRYYGLIGEGD